jgi:ribonucleoside-diphosphate reductase alpha chain
LISQNATKLLKDRYCRAGETPEQVYQRTADFLDIPGLYDAMVKGKFLPNSPALFNSGFKNMMHACCALGVEDDMRSISDLLYNMVMMFKHGAGVGVNYSKLRAADMPLSTGGSSSGVLSFLDVVESVTEYVKQGGYRRGANMALLWYYHPEILNFVQSKLKGDLTNMNLSVMVDDKFMKGVKSDEFFKMVDPSNGMVTGSMRYRDLFDVICACAWSCGCPGIVFYDRINRDNKLFPDLIIDTVNPCAESPIPTNSLCCLGSINISKCVKGTEFDFDKFGRLCELGAKSLNSMNKKGWYPFDFMKEAMDKYNPFGVGIMGFADALIKLGIYYDSKECLDFIDQVGAVWKRVTDTVDPDAFYHRIIAPTGSLSILADCSASIEPIFAEVFERSLTVGRIEETRNIYKSQYLRVAHEIAPEWHIKVQAQWQKWADGGISKTINLPYNASIEDIKAAYMLAYESGCKGITVYRDMSKSKQVLYAMKPSCEGDTCYL